MAQQILNIGLDPGNLGDGDSLRDAFTKVQANFDELYAVRYVTDTTLDHGDPSIVGSIAYELLAAQAEGGGVVQLGVGRFVVRLGSLTLPENVVLKGVSRRATTLVMDGPMIGIALQNIYTGVESMMISMPYMPYVTAIKITVNQTHLRDLLIEGGHPSGWAIDVDGANICSMQNLRLGGDATNAFRGNGIIFQNTAWQTKPWNFGDSMLAKIDISLGSNGTTGIMFSGPENTKLKINNVLLSQVEVVGQGPASGCIGVKVRNASRIVFQTVDLENLGIGVVEESIGTGQNQSSNNVYSATFALGCTIGYISGGAVTNRTFIGCNGFKTQQMSEGDVLLPRGIWFDSGGRITLQGGAMQFDGGGSNQGFQALVNKANPEIMQVSTSQTSQFYLGRTGTRGVECVPGLILPIQTTRPTSPKNGSLYYFAAGVVGASEGLYHLRSGVWVYIR